MRRGRIAGTVTALTRPCPCAEAYCFDHFPVRAPEQLVQLQSLGINDAEPHPIVGSVVDAVRDAKVFAGICD
jgi:hypothetical protein